MCIFKYSKFLNILKINWNKNISIILFTLFNFDVFADAKIKECLGENTSKWENCRGATTYGLSAYVGEFQNGSPNGFGTFTYSDGATYVGEFKNGKEHGTGTFKCWAHGSKYIGEFSSGQKHGKGTYTYPDGVVYTGDWVKGKRDGYGIMKYTDGRKLEGKFKDDNLYEN